MNYFSTKSLDTRNVIRQLIVIVIALAVGGRDVVGQSTAAQSSDVEAQNPVSAERSTESDSASPVVLRNLAEVAAQIDRTDVDRLPVDLDVRVNYWDSRDRNAFIEDGHDSIFLSVPASLFQAFPRLAPTVWIHVKGELVIDKHYVRAHSVEVIRQSDGIVDRALNIGNLRNGECWGQRANTVGVIREVVKNGNRWCASMGSRDTRYIVQRFNDSDRRVDWNQRIGQFVRVRGVLTCDLDYNGQPYRYVVRTNEFDPEIRPARPRVTGYPKQRPVVDLSVSDLSAAKVGSENLFRIDGQITSVVEQDGYLIESGATGVYVHTKLASSDLLGHLVEVLVQKNQSHQYQAVFLTTNKFKSLPPAPVFQASEVDVATLPQRATMEADLLATRSVGEKRILYLQDGQVSFAAIVNVGDQAWQQLDLGGARTLNVSGLLVPAPEPMSDHRGESTLPFVLELSDLGDMEVVSRWWQFSPSFAIASLSTLTVLFAVGMACFAWMWLKMQRADRVNRRLAAQLMQSQKMDALGRLAGGVAHDFNNLLAGIGSNLELIDLKGGCGDREGRQCLASARRCADQATKLVRSLLGFSRQERLELEIGDINRAVEDSALLAKSSFDPNIDVVLNLGRNLPPSRFDHAQLEQVLLNLFFNARDAMQGRSGTIHVETDVIEDNLGVKSVTILVRDSGQGMRPDVAARVFEPFYTTKRVGEGTGLGLALAYGIISQHDGTIACSSEPGQGSLFTITLPAATTKDAAKRGQVKVLQSSDVALDSHSYQGQPFDPGMTGNSKQLCVLLIDDDDEVRRVAKMSLEALGHRVVDLSEGQAAIEYLLAGSVPDVVMLDLVMPNLSGRETLVKIKSINPEIPVVVCSGMSVEIENFVQGLPHRPDAQLSKPFQLADLQVVLQQVVVSRPSPVAETTDSPACGRVNVSH